MEHSSEQLWSPEYLAKHKVLQEAEDESACNHYLSDNQVSGGHAMQEAESRENPRVFRSDGAYQIDQGREAHSSQSLSHYTTRDTIGSFLFPMIFN